MHDCHHTFILLIFYATAIFLTHDIKVHSHLPQTLNNSHHTIVSPVVPARYLPHHLLAGVPSQSQQFIIHRCGR